jgi:hypothetical protein
MKNFSIFGTLICWFAIIGQFYLSIENRTTTIDETIIRFFSYFTILTNILVAAYFTANLLNKENAIKKFFAKPGVLTAITVYITSLGIIYQFLLRHIWDPKGLQLIVNELLHSVIPILFAVYWWLYENKKSLRWNFIWSWLAYPLIYCIYILIRGSFSNFYPYPFVDVNVLGYQKVIINALFIAFFFALVAVIFIAIAKKIIKKTNIQVNQNPAF